jgi:hypothetical protein
MCSDYPSIEIVCSSTPFIHFINSRLFPSRTVYQKLIMVEQDADHISTILDGFGVLSLDDDFISCFRRGNFVAVKEKFPQALTFDEKSDANLICLENILQKHRNTEHEANLWVDLRTKQISPIFIATLAFGLLATESAIYHHGLILYAILLGMEPSTTIWNPVLFHPILAHLITAQQLLENGGQLDGGTKATLELAHSLLGHVSSAFAPRLSEMLDRDVLIAFIEITVKLATGMRAEFDTFEFSLRLRTHIWSSCCLSSCLFCSSSSRQAQRRSQVGWRRSERDSCGLFLTMSPRTIVII